MYKQCGTLTPAGLSKCNARLKKAFAMVISFPGTEYTAAELASFTKTKANLATDKAIKSIYIPLSDYKDGTGDPEIIKSSLGVSGVFDDPVPVGVAYMNSSWDDYKTMFGNNNSRVDIEFLTKDGFRLMTPTSNGSYKGLRATIYTPLRMPGDAPMEAHPIHIFFEDVEEFRNMEALPMTGYGKTDIEDATPCGLNLTAIATYDKGSGDIDVKAVLRASDVGFAGLTAFNILGSNVATPAITMTDSGAGGYNLAITKNTSDKLVAGDYVDVQGVKVVSTFDTYITQPFRILVV